MPLITRRVRVWPGIRSVATWNKPATATPPGIDPTYNRGIAARKDEKAPASSVQSVEAGWSQYLEVTMGLGPVSTTKTDGYEMDIREILEREIDHSVARAELNTEGPGSPPRGFRNVPNPRDLSFIEHAMLLCGENVSNSSNSSSSRGSLSSMEWVKKMFKWQR